MPNPNPAFDQAEYDARLAKTRAAMEAAGIELLIVSDPSNMAWLTGYDGWSFYVHQCVVLGLAEPPLWYGRMQDTEGAYRTVWMSDDRVLGYPDTYVQNPDAHPMAYLAAHLADHGRTTARIGVEMDNYWFTAKAYQSLIAGLPDARFTDATGLVNWQRAVKSPQELNYMRTAARFTERIMERIVERAAPGLRKCDLVADIYDASLRFHEDAGCGGDYPAIVPLLPSGSDAAAPHLTWDDRPLRTGEGTCFEVAGVHQRYHCPLARTLFLGTPTPEFLEAEKAVLEGLEAGLEQARPGNRCQDVAGAFFAVLARHGITKDSRTGYPIGLSYPPDWGERTMSLRPGDTTVLEPGMTFHFMTGLWQGGWGFELTESFAVTDVAPECLANVPRRLFVKS